MTKFKNLFYFIIIILKWLKVYIYIYMVVSKCHIRGPSMHLVFWRKNIASQGAVNFVMILIVIIIGY